MVGPVTSRNHQTNISVHERYDHIERTVYLEACFSFPPRSDIDQIHGTNKNPEL